MNLMGMLAPGLGGGGPSPNPLTGIGMPGGPGGLGGPPGIPPQLLNQIMPSPTPEGATGGGMMQDPRIMAYINALRGGGFPGMGR